MAYGDNDEVEVASPRAVARKTFGGWVFAASNLLGAAFMYLTQQSPANREALEAEAGWAAAGGVVAAVVAASLAYRVMTGKGWIAGSVLLVWYVIETLFKLAGGTLNVGWGLMHAACICNLFKGVMACWELKGDPGESEATEQAY